MAFDVGSLVAQLRLDQKQFEASIQTAKSGFHKLGSFAKTASVGVAALTAAAVGVGAAIQKLTQDTANIGDNFAKMSQRVGLSVETLSSLDHAAKISGTTIDAVAIGLKGLAGRALDAKQGLAEARRSFDALGISVTQADGSLRPAKDLLLEISDRIAGMTNETEKVALATEVFGRSGMQLLPMLNQGSAGIAELMAESDRLGLTWDSQTSKAAEDFNDSMTRLRGSVRGVANSIFQDLMPGTTGIAEKTAEWIGKNRELIALTVSDWIHGTWSATKNLWEMMTEGMPIMGDLVNILAEMPRSFAFNLGQTMGVFREYQAEWIQIWVDWFEKLKDTLPFVDYFQESYQKLLEMAQEYNEKSAEWYEFGYKTVEEIDAKRREIELKWNEYRLKSQEETLDAIKRREEVTTSEVGEFWFTLEDEIHRREMERIDSVSEAQRFATRQTQNFFAGSLKAMMIDSKNSTQIMKGIWKSFANAVIDELARMIAEAIMLEGVLQSIKALLSFIPGFGPASSVSSAASIPGTIALAEGGIVGAQKGLITTSPTLMPIKAVSETYEPEITAPLSQFPALFRETFGSAGGGVSVTVNAAGDIDGEGIARLVGEKVRDVLWSQVG